MVGGLEPNTVLSCDRCDSVAHSMNREQNAFDDVAGVHVSIQSVDRLLNTRMISAVFFREQAASCFYLQPLAIT